MPVAETVPIWFEGGRISAVKRETRRAEARGLLAFRKAHRKQERSWIEELRRGRVPNIVGSLPGALFDALSPELSEAYRVGSRRADLDLERARFAEAGEPDELAIAAYLASTDDALWRYSKRVQRRIETVVRRGSIEGWETDTMIRAVQESVAEMRTWQAERIVRTETMRLYNFGHFDRASSMPETLGYRYDVLLDGRTSEICRPLAGLALKAADFQYLPPLHPNCRTVVQPVFVAPKEWGDPALVEPVKGGFGRLPGQSAAPAPPDKPAPPTIDRPMRSSIVEREIESRFGAIAADYIAEHDWIEAEASSLVALRGQAGFEERARLWYERDSAHQKLRAQTAEAIRPLFYRDRPAKFKVFGTKDPAVKRGVDFVKNMLGDGVLDEGAITITFGKRRSHYIPNKNRARIESGTHYAAEHAVHELGHWIEEKIQAVHRSAKLFLSNRTASDRIVHMNDTVHERLYAVHEVTKPDAFFHPYVGKIFDEGTEVVSMGLQQLFADPLFLFMKDREHFRLLIDVFWGLHDEG